MSTTTAVILASGRGVRHLDPTESYPTALSPVPGAGTVLAWQRSALHRAGVRAVHVVGGYHLEKIVQAFPELSHRYHEGWADEGELAALAVAARWLDGAEALLIVPAPALFREGVVRAMLDAEGEVVTAGAPHARATLLLVRGPARDPALELARRLAAGYPGAGLGELVASLGAGPAVTRIDGGGDLASVLEPRGLASFVLGTKGETLERLRPLVRGAIIPEAYSFPVGRWQEDRDAVVEAIRARFGPCPLVVRSSSLLEDLWTSSRAGEFHSALDVDPAGLPDAVDRVIASYGGDPSPDDQVLVQPHVGGAVCNGVMFTRHPGDGGPYVTINYEWADGATDTVTSGRSRRARTRIRLRDATLPAGGWEGRLLELGRELEALVHLDGLNLEFAVDRDHRLHLFQVRPLAGRPGPATGPAPFADDDLRREIELVRRFVRPHLGPSPTLLGRRGALGVMPDWNPAEIVGLCPRPLALSLYRHLITNEAWSEARRRMGYRALHAEPLVLALAGRPYVNVRASFNSFLPAGLDDRIGTWVVDGAIERLAERPELHDKIEFELLPTAYDLDPGRWRTRYGAEGRPPAETDELLGRLRTLTEDAVHGRRASIAHQTRLLEGLAARRREVLAAAARSRSGGPAAPCLAAHRLLEDARRRGTVPFSILARHAFVALGLLRSLVRRDVLDPAALDAIGAALPTVASRWSADLARYAAGTLSRAALLERYGHLRPDTYNITSPSYAEAPERYLPAAGRAMTAAAPPPPRPEVDGAGAREILEGHRRDVERCLADAGLDADFGTLVRYVVEAIPAREAAKFEFTRNLSAALGLLARAGTWLELDRDDLSYLTIERLLQLAFESPTAAERTELHRVVGLWRKRHAITMSLRLPPVIFELRDLEDFTLPPSRPNFVTRRRVVAPAVHVTGGHASGARPSGVPMSAAAFDRADLDGKLVLIESADPGYDWIFQRPIRGLITEFGGVASHMAIRASEFGIPAAIGCGDALFAALRRAPRVELDCEAERVRGVG